MIKPLAGVVFLTLSLFAEAYCPFNDTYFFAQTLNTQDVIEVCVSQDTLRYTTKHRNDAEHTISQPLSQVQLHKVLNGYELIVEHNDTLYAIMDNDQRPSLLTVNEKRGVVFFTDLDNTQHFLSRLYALNLAIHDARVDLFAEFDGVE